MTDFFIWIYELLLGVQRVGKVIDKIWREHIYLPTGLWLFLSAFIIALAYYQGVNRVWTKYHKLGYWVLTLLFTAFLNFVIALIFVYIHGGDSKNSCLSSMPLACVETYLFAFVNMFYATILFFIFSMLVKWGSPASRTPF